MAVTGTNGFLLPPGTTTDRLPGRLEDGVRLQPDGASKTRTTFLDSFDWRLFDAGRLLEVSEADDDQALALRAVSNGRVTDQASVAATPRWPADLAPGRLRNRLAKALEMRVLLPVVEVDRRVHRFRVLNEDDKTVAWLYFEQPQCRAPGRREPRSLLPRIHLQAVRGYDAETAGIAARLRDSLELPDAPPLLFREALAAVGREPGDYSSKIRVDMAPDQPAAEAARHIFVHLLDTLEANIDGTRRDLDSEFLHDLRVATRRTRSALTQIKGVLPPSVLEDFKARFAWLGQVTSSTRDLDVFLLTFPDYQAQLPASQRPALEPLRTFLVEHQRTEQAALRRRLSSPHFRKLLREWRAFLEAPWGQDPASRPNAARPVKAVADERIWRMYRRVLREGRAIGDESPATDLHELRKSCKKLRYLIEFFQPLYGDATAPLVAALKRLLDNLGEFQDLEIQASKLAHFGEQMQQESEVPMPTLMALGGLVSDLLRRQTDARAQFHDRFKAFDRKSNRTAYRSLFRSVAGQ